MLKADIYLPAARGTYPVVLLVSGGSVNDWRTATFYTSFARVLASLGEGDQDARLAPHSALVQARERGDRFPPTLVVRSGRDAKTLNDSIDAFVAAALAKNAPVSLINYPRG
jgi:hypothetical protein